MNAALHLYSGEPESLPASDARQYCLVFRVSPEQARHDCGDAVDALTTCACGTVIIAPQRKCEECLMKGLRYR